MDSTYGPRLYNKSNKVLPLSQSQQDQHKEINTEVKVIALEKWETRSTYVLRANQIQDRLQNNDRVTTNKNKEA